MPPSPDITRDVVTEGEMMLFNNNADFPAIKISVTGDFETILLDRSILLQSIYTAIGCRYVEVLQPTDAICLWVDEEGLLNHSDPNLLATLVAAELGTFPQVLRGTVVVTGGADGEGNTLPVTEQDLRLLETIVDRISGLDRRNSTTPDREDRSGRKHDLGSYQQIGRKWGEKSCGTQ